MGTCLFRIAAEELKPCVWCHRDTTGRTVDGPVVCSSCYHNVGKRPCPERKCGDPYVPGAENSTDIVSNDVSEFMKNRETTV